jgi:hypothetical protein
VSGVVRTVRPAAEQFTDPTNARLILLSAGGLALLGLGVLIGTIWWWRNSRLESQALAPLEVMSGRKWMRATYGERQQLLDDVRPPDAYAVAEARAKPEQVDLSDLVRSTPEWLDNLGEGAITPDDVWLAEQLRAFPPPAVNNGGELPDPFEVSEESPVAVVDGLADVAPPEESDTSSLDAPLAVVNGEAHPGSAAEAAPMDPIIASLLVSEPESAPPPTGSAHPVFRAPRTPDVDDAADDNEDSASHSSAASAAKVPHGGVVMDPLLPVADDD